ncbi:uncharacterized protein LOC18434307 isoform X1 [Amborella trichopoda]|uniref:uncharacterized protein LOC18434307 isoform X1 n=2 Tax=Amborella trichopoda TaxID=13333 RepID=UPI0005D2E005|nr:uncharacterized protein LOC18434307 isoform X1 [Amborella trichopoda]|eukprot:XP_011623390.1 uncharacterized protein LOC18434307 isoform X1 [Amborella trichopoda]
MVAPKSEYNPPEEFQEVNLDPLVGIPMTDSTELWLIQLPQNQNIMQFKSDDGINRRHLSLKLHHNGRVGTVENNSGKTFDVVSYTNQEPNATVILPGGQAPKIVGKISRRVCLVSNADAEDDLVKPYRTPYTSLKIGQKNSRKSESKRLYLASGEKSSRKVGLISSGEESRAHKHKKSDETPSSAFFAGNSNKEKAPSSRGDAKHRKVNKEGFRTPSLGSEKSRGGSSGASVGRKSGTSVSGVLSGSPGKRKTSVSGVLSGSPGKRKEIKSL